MNKTDDDRKDDAVKSYFRYEPNTNLTLSLVSTYMKKDDDANTTDSEGDTIFWHRRIKKATTRKPCKIKSD